MTLDADAIHRWTNLIVGFNIPRRWLRKLSHNKRLTLIKYVRYVWYKVNDNNPKRVHKPRWLPKKYL